MAYILVQAGVSILETVSSEPLMMPLPSMHRIMTTVTPNWVGSRMGLLKTAMTLTMAMKGRSGFSPGVLPVAGGTGMKAWKYRNLIPSCQRESFTG